MSETLPTQLRPRRRVRTNETKQTHDTAEHLDNEDLDEQVGVRGICKGGGGAGDADGDTAEEIARADGKTSPEERVS